MSVVGGRPDVAWRWSELLFLANSRLKSMGECRYSVRSGIPKFPSKAGELEQVFPGTITQPMALAMIGPIPGTVIRPASVFTNRPIALKL